MQKNNELLMVYHFKYGGVIMNFFQVSFETETDSYFGYEDAESYILCELRKNNVALRLERLNGVINLLKEVDGVLSISVHHNTLSDDNSKITESLLVDTWEKHQK